MKKKPKKSKKLKVCNSGRIASGVAAEAFMNQFANAMKDLANATNKPKTNAVHTHCTNCNLKLVIPEVESYRCLLCGCKELTKRPWSQT